LFCGVQVNFTYFYQLVVVRGALLAYLLVHAVPSARNGPTANFGLLSAGQTYRSFRGVFQSPWTALWDVLLLIILNVATSGQAVAEGTATATGFAADSGWLSIETTVRLLLTSLMVSRAKELFCKLEFMAVHTITCFVRTQPPPHPSPLLSPSSSLPVGHRLCRAIPS
jgi:hypothetical protein